MDGFKKWKHVDRKMTWSVLTVLASFSEQLPHKLHAVTSNLGFYAKLTSHMVSIFLWCFINMLQYYSANFVISGLFSCIFISSRQICWKIKLMSFKLLLLHKLVFSVNYWTALGLIELNVDPSLGAVINIQRNVPDWPFIQSERSFSL